MKRVINKDENGFTIIEVLIVLAIAGLIMLIVFEAIPALTRNSRNSQRKHDASLILEAVSHYELNNSGNFPPGCSGGGATSCSSTVLKDYNLDSKLSYYNANNTGGLSIIPQSTLRQNLNGSNLSGNNDLEIQVFNYEKCQDPGSNPISTPQGAGYSDVVIIYNLEQGNGGWFIQCQQL